MSKPETIVGKIEFAPGGSTSESVLRALLEMRDAEIVAVRKELTRTQRFLKAAYDMLENRRVLK